MRTSVIQMTPGADKCRNIAMAQALIDEALMTDQPAMVSLPEMWTCLGGDRATKMAQAENLPTPGEEGGPAWRFLRDTARRHRLIVHGGSIGERDGDVLFNTTLLFGPDGTEQARYRKIHLFDVTTPNGTGYRESALFGAGTSPVTRVIDGACLGLSICYDIRFPELYLALRRAGADIIFIPSAFTVETGRDHWDVLIRARAIETQCWIVAAATTGTHHDGNGQPRFTWGHSMICDPWGHIRASRADLPGVASADIDLAMLPRIRSAMPVLDHRVLC